MKKRKNVKSKSTHLAIYFGLFLFFIILVSFVFKTLDLIGNSRFDGHNRFTVAIVSENTTDFISVSPRDKTLSRLLIKGVLGKNEAKKYLIPVDSYVENRLYSPGDPKTAFSKILFGINNSKTNLTIIDILRLTFYSSGIDRDNISQESVLSKDEDKIKSQSSELFIDTRLAEEKISIQITNSSNISGYGGKLATYLTNLGANVVLVNSSQKEENKTTLLYRKEKNYTVERLSKILNITPLKRERSSIADVIIVIGKDGEEVLNIR